ncbi:hypothetical protein HK096_004738, partial [Nowakowskiella sp. JEL0078]
MFKGKPKASSPLGSTEKVSTSSPKSSTGSVHSMSQRLLPSPPITEQKLSHTLKSTTDFAPKSQQYISSSEPDSLTEISTKIQITQKSQFNSGPNSPTIKESNISESINMEIKSSPKSIHHDISIQLEATNSPEFAQSTTSPNINFKTSSNEKIQNELAIPLSKSNKSNEKVSPSSNSPSKSSAIALALSSHSRLWKKTFNHESEGKLSSDKITTVETKESEANKHQIELSIDTIKSPEYIPIESNVVSPKHVPKISPDSVDLTTPAEKENTPIQKTNSEILDSPNKHQFLSAMDIQKLQDCADPVAAQLRKEAFEETQTKKTWGTRTRWRIGRKKKSKSSALSPEPVSDEEIEGDIKSTIEDDRTSIHTNASDAESIAPSDDDDDDARSTTSVRSTMSSKLGSLGTKLKHAIHKPKQEKESETDVDRFYARKKYTADAMVSPESIESLNAETKVKSKSKSILTLGRSKKDKKKKKYSEDDSKVEEKTANSLGDAEQQLELESRAKEEERRIKEESDENHRREVEIKNEIERQKKAEEELEQMKKLKAEEEEIERLRQIEEERERQKKLEEERQLEEEFEKKRLEELEKQRKIEEAIELERKIRLQEEAQRKHELEIETERQRQIQRQKEDLEAQQIKEQIEKEEQRQLLLEQQRKLEEDAREAKRLELLHQQEELEKSKKAEKKLELLRLQKMQEELEILKNIEKEKREAERLENLKKLEQEKESERLRLLELEEKRKLEEEIEAQRKLEEAEEAERQLILEREREAERLLKIEQEKEAEQQRKLEKEAEKQRKLEKEKEEDRRRKIEKEQEKEVELQRLAEQEKIVEIKRQELEAKKKSEEAEMQKKQHEIATQEKILLSKNVSASAASLDIALNSPKNSTKPTVAKFIPVNAVKANISEPNKSTIIAQDIPEISNVKAAAAMFGAKLKSTEKLATEDRKSVVEDKKLRLSTTQSKNEEKKDIEKDVKEKKRFGFSKKDKDEKTGKTDTKNVKSEGSVV